MKPNLKIVDEETKPPIDIHAIAKAQIKGRDWRSVHIAGDRRQPVEFGPRYGFKLLSGGWWQTEKRS